MPIKVNINDNTSNIRVKTSSSDEVKVKSDCKTDISRLEALIRQKQNLGFIYLDEYLDPNKLGGTLPRGKLNLLIDYLINKVSLEDHVYYLISSTPDSLSYVCPDLEVQDNQIDVNIHNGFFNRNVSRLDHSSLTNLDYLSSGHTGFAGIEFGTTEYWNSRRTYVPPKGMIVVYTDYYLDEDTGEYIPNFKIGNGNAYLVDIAFTGDATKKELEEHIADNVMHITQEERERWNNKLNYNEPADGLLQFTRN